MRWRTVLVAGLLLAGCADDGGAGAPGDTVAAPDSADSTQDGTIQADSALDAGADGVATGDTAVPGDTTLPGDTAGPDGLTDAGAPDDTAAPDVATPDAAGPDAGVDDATDTTGTTDATDAGEPDDAATTEDSDVGVVPLDPATVPLRGACPQETRLGGFLVEVQELFSVVDGKVLSAVDPNTVLEVVLDEGNCLLNRTDYPACDPLCNPGETCSKQGCVPFPLQQDVGTVTIVGLEKLVVMTPKPPGNNYFDTNMPNPAFLPGNAIGLTSTPGFAGELAMYGVGSKPMQLVQPAWVVESGKALDFTWDPPPEGARTHIALRMTLDQHGNTPVSLTCELPDTGAGAIPAALITELLSYGVSGFPNATLSRRTADSVDIGKGCVDFVIGAPVNPSITIVGHYPCTSTADCPNGLTCNVPIETCE